MAISRKAVDPLGPDDGEAFVMICTVSRQRAAGLAFLHLPLEAGRASLTVFARPDASRAGSASGADVAAGVSNLPLMMASLELVAPADTQLLRTPASSVNHPTSASPATLMNWTRTGKNFDLLHAGRADGSPLEPHAVFDVVVRPRDKAHAFVHRASNAVLSFEPPTGRYPNPLHVHRHHAVISTTRAPGPGRPVEMFGAAFRTFGDRLSLEAGARTLRLVEFETPAAPLAYGLPKDAKLAMFTSAYFDLFSVLGNRYEHDFAGPPARLQSLSASPHWKGRRRAADDAVAGRPRPQRRGIGSRVHRH